MTFRTILLSLVVLSLGACSGAIYRSQGLKGNDPIAITIDARQRVLLSQPDRATGRTGTALFRRFCAEPSPDVFTVLGAAASGGGSLGLGADKSVSAALQGAFSSNETGASIARTQTVNLLREMMFRTCERYLSGAISAEEFAIIAARDQRVIVSTLAIEQLTGALTPPAVVITAGGSAETGFDPTELIKALETAQRVIKEAADGVKKAQDGVAKAEKDAAGGCQALRDNKPTDEPSLAQIKACDEADLQLIHAQTVEKVAQANLARLTSASERGLGVSSASVNGGYAFASAMGQSASVSQVADAVRRIVTLSFEQDETQLFCIRTLYRMPGRAREPALEDQCRAYLLTRVQADQQSLAMRYGLSLAQVRAAIDAGTRTRLSREEAARRFHACAARPEQIAGMRSALAQGTELLASPDTVIAAAKASEGAFYDMLADQTTGDEARIIAALGTVCP